jgi:ribosomal protein S18 acetylase RimI-like enzyme
VVEDLQHEIRPARMSDAGVLAGLMGELGYPVTSDEVGLRLRRLLGRDGAGVLVAVARSAAVGVCSYQLIQSLERTQRRCRLTTLVVRADQRRSGVARALVAEVEAVARHSDCFRLEVTTQPTRDAALAFYAAVGFTDRPHRLIKAL